MRTYNFFKLKNFSSVIQKVEEDATITAPVTTTAEADSVNAKKEADKKSAEKEAEDKRI